ncbi:MAG: glycosyltransferase [bacterium]|nr:glycosyltransferase [bacterium]
MTNSPVQVAVLIGAISVILEVLAAWSTIRSARLVGYGGVLMFAGFSGTLLFVLEPGVLTFTILLISMYRGVNAGRVITARMHPLRALYVTRRTSWQLILFLLIAIFLWATSNLIEISNNHWLWGLSALAFIVSIIINLSVHRNLRYSSLQGSDKYRLDIDLPTVSVCIPARNETADLPACLSSILDSNYPKLEVLVLDDCSQDQTSEIIKSFAHGGVRFIKGEASRKNWLAKNQAYQQLAEAASGNILLFCGVDVRFGKKAIWSMIDCLHSRNKKMISVLPKGLQANEQAGLIQPMRYWWELAWPRRLFNRPPVLSSCWMIEKEALRGFGNFNAVNNTVIPEVYFARELIKSDTYSFLRSSKKLEVLSNKNLPAQWNTAIRTRYPELRKRPEVVLLVTLGELGLLILPLSLFIAGFLMTVNYLWILSGITTLLINMTHYRIIKAWQLDDISTPLAMMPVAFLLEIFILQASMYRYEFSEVDWKERNICIPVMRAIPRLPPA